MIVPIQIFNDNEGSISGHRPYEHDKVFNTADLLKCDKTNSMQNRVVHSLCVEMFSYIIRTML